MNNCASCWEMLKDYYGEHMFLSGIWAGLLLVLMIYLILLLLRLFFLPKRVSVISYATEHGAISIRASAISDLIRSVGMDFQELSIAKSVLLRKRGKTYLRVFLDYRAGARSFQSVVSDFQKRVFEALAESFAITEIRHVEVAMRGIYGKPEPHRTHDEKQEQDGEEDTVSQEQ